MSENKLLKSKTAVITGGSRGIGAAIAEKFAANGARVVIIYSGNDETAQSVVDKCSAYGTECAKYKCDVSSFEQTAQTFELIRSECGNIDILVNNAGITRDRLLLQMTEEDFDKVIAVNLKGAFNTCKAVCRSMSRAKHGRIINISSVSGMMGNPGQVNYSASKAGIIGLTKTIAKEYASRNINCNAIAPGFVQTDMTAAMSQTVLDAAAQSIPLKRLGQPEDIANVALFLASDMAAYITGEVIKADGGLYI